MSEDWWMPKRRPKIDWLLVLLWSLTVSAGLIILAIACALAVHIATP